MLWGQNHLLLTGFSLGSTEISAFPISRTELPHTCHPKCVDICIVYCNLFSFLGPCRFISFTRLAGLGEIAEISLRVQSALCCQKSSVDSRWFLYQDDQSWCPWVSNHLIGASFNSIFNSVLLDWGKWASQAFFAGTMFNDVVQYWRDSWARAETRCTSSASVFPLGIDIIVCFYSTRMLCRPNKILWVNYSLRS